MKPARVAGLLSTGGRLWIGTGGRVWSGIGGGFRPESLAGFGSEWVVVLGWNTQPETRGPDARHLGASSSGYRLALRIGMSGRLSIGTSGRLSLGMGSSFGSGFAAVQADDFSRFLA